MDLGVLVSRKKRRKCWPLWFLKLARLQQDLHLMHLGEEPLTDLEMVELMRNDYS
jgi:hypothetical protein